jgi:aminopeptidase
MKDTRYDQLAGVLTGFSTKLQRGERVLIDAFDVPDEIVVALIRAARARGALPYVQVNRATISREMLRGATKEQVQVSASLELARMKKMDAYIAVRGANNIFEASDVPADRARLVNALMRPVPRPGSLGRRTAHAGRAPGRTTRLHRSCGPGAVRRSR